MDTQIYIFLFLICERPKLFLECSGIEKGDNCCSPTTSETCKVPAGACNSYLIRFSKRGEGGEKKDVRKIGCQEAVGSVQRARRGSPASSPCLQC